MGRLTVRLPDTLHHQLTNLADKEGVSLNQYIVYALTRQSSLAYVVESVPAEEVEKQRALYEEFIMSLGQATPEEIEQVLSQRESAKPESKLEALAIERLQEKIASRKIVRTNIPK
ncbi:MAG: toxin-antitoxin system HicB family antitoxin [Anaerolineae bacterium]|nr:toxin-antitoxin system HicB family antitoxin [Anaerolineae bacterium]